MIRILVRVSNTGLGSHFDCEMSRKSENNQDLVGSSDLFGSVLKFTSFESFFLFRFGCFSFHKQTGKKTFFYSVEITLYYLKISFCTHNVL